MTVVGPGGIGKTRLAEDVCAEIASTFPVGVHRCELAWVAPPRDIDLEVAGQLGFPSIDALVVGLGDEPGVLVLDNCEHVLHAVGRLCAYLADASPTLHLLATSREPLGIDGEQLFLLGPLPLPATTDRDEIARAPAIRLFEDRARAHGASIRASDEQLAAVVELCRRLDGLPLAIELAAARIRSMTAVELLGHLDRRFELLRGTNAVGRSRHRSLRAAIDASYELHRRHSLSRPAGRAGAVFDIEA